MAVFTALKQIHRDEERFEHYEKTDLLHWSEQLNCWLVSDLDLILEVLKNTDFQAENSVEESLKLANGLKIDLTSTQMIFGNVPLSLEGKRHAEMRRQMAVEITGQSAAILTKIAAFAAENVVETFRSGATFNIVENLFQPAVRILMTELTGLCLAGPLHETAPTQIFDRQIGASRRKIIEQKIKQIYAVALETDSAQRAQMRVALMLVGSDSMLGALAESFVHDVRNSAGKNLSDVAWSEVIPITSVPYVERIAKNDVMLGGTAVEKDQRVRVYLDAFKNTEKSRKDHYFGAGRHVCLGKALSQSIWKIFVDEFRKIDVQWSVQKIEYRQVDFLFNMPITIKMERL